MGHTQDNEPRLPPRIHAALEYLHHTRMVTEQTDVAIPTRPLSQLEKSVESAALRALQQYLMGEMDFTDPPPEHSKPPRKDDDDPGAREPVASAP